jgi:hypothetical protein
MADLTAITTPFGLLDEATRAELKAHGGPYEVYAGDRGWYPKPYSNDWPLSVTIRVKPAVPVSIGYVPAMFQTEQACREAFPNRDPIRVQRL